MRCITYILYFIVFLKVKSKLLHFINIHEAKDTVINYINKNDYNLFMIGDSTDRFFATALCSLICGYIEPLGNCHNPQHCAKRTWNPNVDFEAKYRMSAGACSCPAINHHTIGFLHFFGVAEDRFFSVYKDYVGAEFGNSPAPRINNAVEAYQKVVDKNDAIANRNITSDKNIFVLQSNMWDVSRLTEMPKTYPPEPRMSNETFLSGYYANMTQLLSNIQQETFNKLYSVDQSTVKPNYKFLYRTQHMPFHPAREYLVPRQTMTEVNELIKKIAAENNLPVFDWEHILVEQMKLNPMVVQWDIVHQSVDTSFLMAIQLLKQLDENTF